MIRVCPKRDAVCPHGMGCPYALDRYDCLPEPKAPAMTEDLKAAVERLKKLAAGLRDQRLNHLPLVDAKHYPALAGDLEALLSALPAAPERPWSVAEAFRKGAMAALGCEPWEDADDFFTLVGLDYANGKPLPPTMPKPSIPAREHANAPDQPARPDGGGE